MNELTYLMSITFIYCTIWHLYLHTPRIV